MLPKKILIVEDEHLIRKTTCMLLNNENFLTVSSETGAAGIDLARQEKPDLILLDMMLPDMDGWIVLRTLKSDPETKEIPIILFTAADCEVPEAAAREQGAISVLHKPFYPHQLFEIIKTL
jgi:DNA-binding response OmpR family regulator